MALVRPRLKCKLLDSYNDYITVMINYNFNNIVELRLSISYLRHLPQFSESERLFSDEVGSTHSENYSGIPSLPSRRWDANIVLYIPGIDTYTI